MSNIQIPYNFTPRPYQIPLFNAFDSGYKRMMFVWHRRCLAKGTKILMSNGRYKNIENIIIGDEVFSYTQNGYVKNKVVQVFNNGIRKINKYNDILATEDHHVLNETRRSYTKLSKAKSLMNASNVGFGTIHNPELAEILGLLLTDGSVKINQTPKFTNIEEGLLQRFEYLVEKVFPMVRTKRYKKGKGYDILCPTEIKTPFHPIRKYFETSNTLPDIVWEFDKESLLSFFAGVIAGDGSISYKESRAPKGKRSPNGYIGFSGQWVIEAGISEELAEDYKLLLLKFGIRTKIKKDPRGRNYRVFSYSLKSLHNLKGINIPHRKKQLRIEFIIENTIANHSIKGEKIYITEAGEAQVYDIEVENSHNYIANGYIVHNSGKDKCAINLVAKSMFSRVGTYFYIFPTYKQGKKILWNGMDKTGFKFINHIPKETVVRKDNTEMILETKNGSILQVIGSDNIDSIVGTNPIGCVFSEFSLQNPTAWDYMSPILAENGGWAIFEFTPRGENFSYDMLKFAENQPDWWTQILTVDDTKAIPPDVLEKEREHIIQRYGDDAFFQQEYYCSFTAPMQGAYYSVQMQQAEKEKRITRVPHDHSLEVHTAWDLGMDDSTTIWFFQVVGREIRFIDYVEDSGEGLQYYVDILKEKRQQYRYSYGKHYLPHDVEVREIGTGISRKQTLQRLGVSNIKTVPKSDIQHGIQQVRNILSRCYFDSEKCKRGINALKSYRKEYNDQNQVYKNTPLHDWSSHGCLIEGTQIMTINGTMSIEDITTKDKILIDNNIATVSHYGYVKTCETIIIELESGKKIECSKEHKIFTTRGVVKAEDIVYTDRIHTKDNPIWDLSQFKQGIREGVISCIKESSITNGKKENYFVHKKMGSKFFFIERCGKMYMARYQFLMKLFKKTMITITSIFQHGYVKKEERVDQFHINIHTKNLMGKNIILKKEDTSIINTQILIYIELFGRIIMEIFRKVIIYIIKITTHIITILLILLYYLPLLILKNMQNIINGSVVRGIKNNSENLIGDGVKLIKEGSIKRVYDITVEKHHCYYANGILTSNSDAFRYFACGYRDIIQTPNMSMILNLDPY